MIAVYLSRGHHIPDWVNTQAKDIICVGVIESLLMTLTIIYNSQSSNMIHYLATLSVEKIVPTVVATVPKKNKVRKINETGGNGFSVVYFLLFLLGTVGEKEICHVTDIRVQANHLTN